MQQDEPRMYFVIPKDLKMAAGKIGAQVGHCSIALFELAMRELFPDTAKLPFLEKSNNTVHSLDNEEKKILQGFFTNWHQHSHTKVVLKADKEQFERLKEICDVYVVDEGRTQIEKNSVTVLGWLPRNKAFIQDHKLQEILTLKLV